MALSLPFRANCPTRADLFRRIFRDHFDRWCDLRLDDEVPADQRAYVRETVQRIMFGTQFMESEKAWHLEKWA